MQRRSRKRRSSYCGLDSLELLEPRIVLRAGLFDTSFDGDGVFNYSPPAGTDFVHTSLHVQADGDLLLAGYKHSHTLGTDGFRIARIEQTANLDATFSGDGWVDHNFGPLGEDNLYDITSFWDLSAHQRRIVTVGQGAAGSGQPRGLVVTMYNQDGSIKGDFASGGSHVIVPPGYNHILVGTRVFVTAIASIPPTILVAGTFSRGSGGDIVVTKLTLTGSIDTAFGTNGHSALADPANDAVSGLVVAENGTIVVGSSSPEVGATSTYRVFRLAANGARDASFGANGLFSNGIVPNNTGSQFIMDIGVQPDNRIVVAGRVGISGGVAGLIFRITPNGLLDTTFSTNAYLTIAGSRNLPSPGGSVFTGWLPQSLALQPDGKIIVVTAVHEGSAQGQIGQVVRFLPDGSPDPSFGTEHFGQFTLVVDGGISGNGVNTFYNYGKKDLPFNSKYRPSGQPPGIESQSDVALLSDGRIVVTFGSAVVRLLGDGIARVFQLYNNTTGQHFWTTNFLECNSVVTAGWGNQSEGNAPWSVSTSQLAGQLSLLRLYSFTSQAHYHTTNGAEAAYLLSLNRPGNVVWRLEDPLGFIFTSPTPNTYALFRLYNTQSQRHYFTTNAGEQQYLLSLGSVWQDHGIVGYVWKSLGDSGSGSQM